MWTLAHSHDLGSLGDGKLVFQNAVENLNPCLFLLIQRYILHKDDIFADQLAGDRIVEHQQKYQGLVQFFLMEFVNQARAFRLFKSV